MASKHDRYQNPTVCFISVKLHYETLIMLHLRAFIGSKDTKRNTQIVSPITFVENYG